MKKLLLLLVFINSCTLAFNQVIKGNVLDKKTNSAVMFATVYFNGTFVGTITDEEGRFELDISKYNSMPLTISAVGYYSFTMPEYSTDEPLTIYLTPKVFELNEVVIHDKSLVKQRRANLKVFKDEFLGTTANSSKCEIVNEEDITFNYNSDKDSLIAYALKPLIIDNRALGYKITYYLDKFEYCKKDRSFLYKGNIIYKEDLTSNEKLKETFERKREKAYLGSRMHFFRALWANDLAANGFIIKDSSGKYLSYKDIVVQDIHHNKTLKYTTNFKLYYNLQLSYLVLRKRMIFFYKNGYFDMSAIYWKEKMAEQRVADLLPYEYQLEQ